jgi:uncharacterized membrane protein YedE/YeeE
MDSVFETWPWYVAGPIIGLFVPLLLVVGNKLFGISSSFEHLCTVIFPKSRTDLIGFNYENNKWKLYFVIGIGIGAYIAVNFLSGSQPELLPERYYSLLGMMQLFIGGLLVGFGTRYADGCTSGHVITGLSLLNLGSLKSTISFFTGGLIYTFISYFIFG